VAYAARSGPMLHLSRGGDGRPYEGHAQARLELQGRHPEARPASTSTGVGMRLPPKMTPAQIAEAQRMAREWKRLGAPGKSRSACALDERAAPREGSFARPTEPAGAAYEVGRCVGQDLWRRGVCKRPRHRRSLHSEVWAAPSLADVILLLLGVRCLKQPALI
jgi:hypothetical protein